MYSETRTFVKSTVHNAVISPIHESSEFWCIRGSCSMSHKLFVCFYLRMCLYPWWDCLRQWLRTSWLVFCLPTSGNKISRSPISSQFQTDDENNDDTNTTRAGKPFLYGFRWLAFLPPLKEMWAINQNDLRAELKLTLGLLECQTIALKAGGVYKFDFNLWFVCV